MNKIFIALGFIVVFVFGIFFYPLLDWLEDFHRENTLEEADRLRQEKSNEEQKMTGQFLSVNERDSWAEYARSAMACRWMEPEGSKRMILTIEDAGADATRFIRNCEDNPQWKLEKERGFHQDE